ncbi:F-box domain-containing protein [Favolaschia claudopus]|uniref:F-box domain-containing protein n=1 Tax=Favolaschia claudopus TaxID=2862362 RepID=A0AAW0CVW6_9AGAR
MAIGDSNSTDKCFSALPTDILFNILEFLSPHDILRLRQVSWKSFHITQERSIWIKLLQQLCSEHDIYAASFPLADLSLDELENITTAGRRFTLRIRRNSVLDQIICPLYIHTIQSSNVDEEFENMRFLPGGRFLLTTNERVLKLWDLGFCAHPPSQDALAFIEIPDATAIVGLRTRASHTNPGALIIVSSTTSCEFCVHIFQISPAASAPEFTLLAPVLVLPGTEYGVIGATSRHIAVAGPVSTVLWNFIDDTWVSWARTPGEFEDAVYLCNDNILILHAASPQLFIAAVPPHFPRSSSESPPLIQSLDVLHVFPLCRFGDEADSLVQCVSGVTLVFHGRELGTEDQPLYIDILSDECGKTLFTHFVIQLAENPSESTNTAVCSIAAVGETVTCALYHLSHSLHLEWLDRETVQSFVVAGNTLHVGVSDVGRESVGGILVTPGLQLNERNVDFCSFSGRVCARVPLDDGDGYKVLVLDYVERKGDHLNVGVA